MLTTLLQTQKLG